MRSKMSVFLWLAVALAGLNVDAAGNELRVTTAADVVACVGGAPLAAGPDAGGIAIAGDECVLDPGTYALAVTAAVTVPNLTVRSRSGAGVTTVMGAGFPVFTVTVPGVAIGGPGSNQGLTITGGTVGVLITGVGLTMADRDITIEGCFINANGIGIAIITPAPISDFHVLTTEVRGSGGFGLVLGPAVGNVTDFEVLNGIFDGNGAGFGPDNIAFLNSGTVRNVHIAGNRILRALGNGIRVGGAVAQVSDFFIANNVIQGNGLGVPPTGGSGILFANAGSVEVEISGHRDGNVGITGNGCAAIFFDGPSPFGGFPLFGGGVTDVEALIADNLINENSPANGFFCPGVVFGNGGDVEDLEALNNEVKLNGGDGFFIANGSDFSGAQVKGNTFANNGNFGGFGIAPFGNGFTAWPQNGVEDNTFEQNVASQNFFHGIFLASLTGNVTNNRFIGERYEQNGLSVPQGFGFVSAGLEISSFGDVSNVEIRNVTSTRNGGSGVYLDANGLTLSGLGLIPVANLGNVLQVGIFDGAFTFNGASAPTGAGDGVFLQGDTVQAVASQNNRMESNDDHGLFVSARDDAVDIAVSHGVYDNNETNNDTIGSGVHVEASNDVQDVTINGVKASGNQSGLSIRVKGQNGNGIVIQDNPEICDNAEAGIKFTANDDATNVNITNNGGGGNGTNVIVQVTDRSTNVVISPNNFGATCTPGPPPPGPGPAGANFTISSFNAAPASVSAGGTVNVTAVVRNGGSAAGTQNVVVRIKDGSGAVVREETFPTALAVAADVTVSVSHTFAANGTFTVEVRTDNDSRTATVTVGGAPPPPGGMSIAEALDVNGNNQLDDGEILAAITLWITGTPVPGVNRTISDVEIRQLVLMWIAGAPIR